MRSRLLWALMFCGCATSQSASVAHRYAQALEAGEARAAYDRLSPAQKQRVSWEEFQKRSLPPPRTETWTSEEGSLALRRVGNEWLLEDLRLNADPRQTVRSFLAAVDGKDFAKALELLSGEWRARYTPEAFAADFAREPLAQQRVKALREALESPVRFTSRGAELPLKTGAVVLVLEQNEYRISQLE